MTIYWSDKSPSLIICKLLWSPLSVINIPLCWIWSKVLMVPFISFDWAFTYNLDLLLQLVLLILPIVEFLLLYPSFSEINNFSVSFSLPNMALFALISSSVEASKPASISLISEISLSISSSSFTSMITWLGMISLQCSSKLT